jgi:hypothetical protein
MATLQLTPGLMSGFSSTSATQYTQYAAVPDSYFMQILAAAFSRYRLVGTVKLHYMPTISTSTSTVVALSMSNDPLNPVIGGRAYYTGLGAVAPNFNTIKAAANAVVFAGWAPWSNEYIVDNDYEYYTFNNSKLERGASTSASAPESFTDRMTYFGALSACSTGTSGLCGELFIEYCVEYSDFAPITNGVTTLGSSTLLDILRRAEAAPEKPILTRTGLARVNSFESKDPTGDPDDPDDPYYSVTPPSVVTDMGSVKGSSSSALVQTSTLPLPPQPRRPAPSFQIR